MHSNNYRTCCTTRCAGVGASRRAPNTLRDHVESRFEVESPHSRRWFLVSHSAPARIWQPRMWQRLSIVRRTACVHMHVTGRARRAVASCMRMRERVHSAADIVGGLLA